MPMMCCVQCEWVFNAEKDEHYRIYVCPRCHSGKWVVRLSHPMARKFDLQMCDRCKDGIMVKVAEVPDPTGNADMEVLMCQKCGRKKLVEKKKK